MAASICLAIVSRCLHDLLVMLQSSKQRWQHGESPENITNLQPVSAFLKSLRLFFASNSMAQTMREL